MFKDVVVYCGVAVYSGVYDALDGPSEDAVCGAAECGAGSESVERDYGVNDEVASGSSDSAEFIG